MAYKKKIKNAMCWYNYSGVGIIFYGDRRNYTGENQLVV